MRTEPMLMRKETNCIYHYADGVRVEGAHDRIIGSVTGITGSVSGIHGDVTGITGDVWGLRGDVSGLTGDVDEIPASERPCNISEYVKENL